jgi:hypothetical protein
MQGMRPKRVRMMISPPLRTACLLLALGCLATPCRRLRKRRAFHLLDARNDMVWWQIAPCARAMMSTEFKTLRRARWQQARWQVPVRKRAGRRIESAVRYLAIEVDDALATAEQVEV